jgi:hypothetical protein
MTTREELINKRTEANDYQDKFTVADCIRIFLEDLKSLQKPTEERDVVGICPIC